MSLVDDVEAPLSYSSAPFYSPIALDDAVPFAKLTNHQVDQLGEARGTRYHCPIANRYQSPAMYPVVTSSALSLLKKDSTINAVSLQLKLLQHLGFDVTGDTFSTEKLLSIQWTRAFLQAIADLYNVLVIVYLENGTNSKQSRFLFITPKPVPTPSSPFMLTLKDDLEIINPKPDLVADRQNALPMVLVQTASSLVFLYRTSLNKDLNSALTVAERNEHNRSRVPAEYAIWPVPPLVRRTHDMDLHAFYVPEDPSGGVFSTGFEYTVKGTEVNNVPQTVAAALVVTPSSVYTDRTLYNFMEMRIITSVAGDKNEGRPLIFDRLNNFIPFTAADLAVLSNHYRVTILVKHVSTQHLPLYAVFTPKKKSLFTIHLVQEKNFFTLVMPQEIPQAGLDAYNSVFTEAERSSPEFLSTLGSTYLPDIIKNNPTVIHTQIVPLFKPVLAQSRQEAPSTFPVCSSSSSLHTKAVPDNPADSCEIVVLEDDSSIPTVSPITENVNSRQYLHAKNPLFSIPLADNFPSVSQTSRRFNANTEFLWRVEFDNHDPSKRWPNAYAAGAPPTLVFIHNVVPGDERRVAFPVEAITSENSVFFERMLFGLCKGSPDNYSAHAILENLKPPGSLEDDETSPSFKNAVVNIDGYMRLFDLIGGITERFGMSVHRYNLFHIYALMVADIAANKLDYHVMTERFLWFLYSFLLVNDTHFEQSNPRITSAMAGVPIDIFADRVFHTLMTAPCFVWEYKLSHTWLFAYITLHPAKCVVPTGYLLQNLLSLVENKTFGSPRFSSSSSQHISTSYAQFMARFPPKNYAHGIPNAALEFLTSWNVISETGFVPQLPFYAVDHSLLFSSPSEAVGRKNALELSIESLFFHNQIHATIQRLDSPSTPGNMDAFFYSLQTMHGIPIHQQAIRGHPSPGIDDPSMARFLYGPKELPADVKHLVPVIKKSLSPVAASDLLLERARKMMMYKEASSKDPSVAKEPKRSTFFTISDPKYFETKEDDSLLLVSDAPLDLTRWKESFFIWSALVNRYYGLTSNKRDPSVKAMWKTLSTSVRELLEIEDRSMFKGTPLFKKLESVKKNLSALSRFLVSVKEWNANIPQEEKPPKGFYVPAAYVRPDISTEFISLEISKLGKQTDDFSIGRGAITELLGSIVFEIGDFPSSPVPPLYPVVLPKQPHVQNASVQPPFQRILRSSLGLSVFGFELIKRAQTRAPYADLKACLWNLTNGLDRTAALLLACGNVSPTWAFPLARGNAKSLPSSEINYVRSSQDDLFFTDEEVQIILQCEFLLDVLSERNPNAKAKAVADLHEKALSEKEDVRPVIQSPLRVKVPVEIIQSLVNKENRILRVATNSTRIQNFTLSNDFFRFFTGRYAFLSDVSVYNGSEVAKPLYDFARNIIAGKKNSSEPLVLSCSCIKASPRIGKPFWERQLANQPRIPESHFNVKTVTAIKYFLEFEIDKCFGAFGTTGSPSRKSFFLHAPLRIKYLGMREFDYDVATMTLSYLMTFSVSISHDTLEKMAYGASNNMSVIGYRYTHSDQEPQHLLSPGNRSLVAFKSFERVRGKTVPVRQFFFSSRRLGYFFWSGVLNNMPYVPNALVHYSGKRYATLEHFNRAKMLEGYEVFKTHVSPWRPGQAANVLDGQEVTDRTTLRYAPEESPCFSNAFMNTEVLFGWPSSDFAHLIPLIPVTYTSVPLYSEANGGIDLISRLSQKARKEKRQGNKEKRVTRKRAKEEEEGSDQTKIQRVGAGLEDDPKGSLKKSGDFAVTPFVASKKAKQMGSKDRARYLASILKDDPSFLGTLHAYLFGGVNAADAKDPEDDDKLKRAAFAVQMHVKRIDTFRATFPEAVWAMEDAYAATRFFSTDKPVVDSAVLYKFGSFEGFYKELGLLLDASPELHEDSLMAEDSPFPRISFESATRATKFSIDDTDSENAATVWPFRYEVDALYAFLRTSTIATAPAAKQKRFITVVTALLAKELNDYAFYHKSVGIVCVYISENLYVLLSRILVPIAQHSHIAKPIADAVFGPWIAQNATIVFVPMFDILERRDELGFMLEEYSRRHVNGSNTEFLGDVCRLRCGMLHASSRFSTSSMDGNACRIVLPRFMWNKSSQKSVVDPIIKGLVTFFSLLTSAPMPFTMPLAFNSIVRENDLNRLFPIGLPHELYNIQDTYGLRDLPENNPPSIVRFYVHRPLVLPLSNRIAKVNAFRENVLRYDNALSALQAHSESLASRLRINSKDTSPSFFDAFLLFTLLSNYGSETNEPSSSSSSSLYLSAIPFSSSSTSSFTSGGSGELTDDSEVTERQEEVAANRSFDLRAAIKNVERVSRARFYLEDYLVDNFLLRDPEKNEVRRKALLKAIGTMDPKSAHKFVVLATHRSIIARFFKDFRDEIPEDLLVKSASTNEMERLEAYWESLAQLQQEEFMAMNVSPRVKREGMKLIAFSDDVPPVHLRSIGEEVDVWAEFFSEFCQTYNYTSRYSIENPNAGQRERALSQAHKEILLNFALASFIAQDPGTSPEINVDYAFAGKIFTSLFLNSTRDLEAVKATLDAFLSNKLYVTSGGSDVSDPTRVNFSSIKSALVDFSSSSQFEVKTEAFTSVFPSETVAEVRSRFETAVATAAKLTKSNFSELDDVALAKALWAAPITPPSKSDTGVDIFAAEINGQPNTHLAALLQELKTELALETNPRDYLQQAMTTILSLNWPVVTCLRVLKVRGALSSTAVIKQHREMAAKDAEEFTGYIARSKQAARAILTASLFQYWEDDLAPILWEQTAMFFRNEEDRDILLRFVRNPKVLPPAGFLEKYNLSVSAATVKKVLDQFNRAARIRFRKINLDPEVYAFTPFENAAIASVWRNITNGDARPKTLLAIKRHEWHLLLTRADIVAIFIRLSRTDPAFNYSRISSEASVTVRKNLAAYFYTNFGRRLIASELYLIQAAQIFNIPIQVIYGCVAASRWTVLHMLVMASVSVYQFGTQMEFAAQAWPEKRTALSVDINQNPDLPDTIDADNALSFLSDSSSSSGGEETETDSSSSSNYTLMTTQVLNAYLDANIRFYKEVSSIKKRTKTAVALNKELKEFYFNGLDVFIKRGRFSSTKLAPADPNLVAKPFMNRNSLFITLSYLVRGVGTNIKPQLVSWLKKNLHTPIADSDSRTFRDVFHIPNTDTSVLSDKDLLSYLNSINKIWYWNDFVMLLAASNCFERPIHLVTTLDGRTNWQATFVASDAHLQNETLHILAINMLCYAPLAVQGTTYR